MGSKKASPLGGAINEQDDVEAQEPQAPSSGVVQRPVQEVADCLACSLCTRILMDPITAPECMHR